MSTTEWPVLGQEAIVSRDGLGRVTEIGPRDRCGRDEPFERARSGASDNFLGAIWGAEEASMVKRLLMVVGLMLAGCETDPYRQAGESWVGRPVRELAEHRSMVPDGYHDDKASGGRTFIFSTTAPLGNRCGFTVWSLPAGRSGEYLIKGIQTNCPALLL